MAKDPKRRMVSIGYAGGAVEMTIGLMEFLGLNNRGNILDALLPGRRRHTRRSRSKPGEPVELLLSDGSTWGVTVVGPMRKFEDEFFVKRRAPKIVKATTALGTEYKPIL
ncbi:MAG: hypothetical protein LW834_18925 [Cyanobium sp. 49614_E6]|jgi:hypothetical protein|nr:hypothetical protein [Cyanobium sp. 49614_E6]